MGWLIFIRDLLFMALGVSIFICVVFAVAIWAGLIEITGCGHD